VYSRAASSKENKDGEWSTKQRKEDQELKTRRRIPGSGYLARTSRESNAGSPGCSLVKIGRICPSERKNGWSPRSRMSEVELDGSRTKDAEDKVPNIL